METQPDLPTTSSNELEIFQANPTRSVFVRDLPYACTSTTLKELVVEKLGDVVEQATVCENRKKRNLQFGCVLFESEEMVQRAVEELNLTRFQGRDIRVLRFDPNAPSESSSIGSIHVSFKSLVSRKQLTEEDLRDAFSSFGDIDHVSIRSLKIADDGLQGGYGFLNFKTAEQNTFAAEKCSQLIIGDVLYDCQWSQRMTSAAESGEGAPKSKGGGRRQAAAEAHRKAASDDTGKTELLHEEQNIAKVSKSVSDSSLTHPSSGTSKIQLQNRPRPINISEQFRSYDSHCRSFTSSDNSTVPSSPLLSIPPSPAPLPPSVSAHAGTTNSRPQNASNSSASSPSNSRHSSVSPLYADAPTPSVPPSYHPMHGYYASSPVAQYAVAGVPYTLVPSNQHSQAQQHALPPYGQSAFRQSNYVHPMPAPAPLHHSYSNTQSSVSHGKLQHQQYYYQPTHQPSSPSKQTSQTLGSSQQQQHQKQSYNANHVSTSPPQLASSPQYQQPQQAYVMPTLYASPSVYTGADGRQYVYTSAPLPLQQSQAAWQSQPAVGTTALHPQLTLPPSPQMAPQHHLSQPPQTVSYVGYMTVPQHSSSVSVSNVNTSGTGAPGQSQNATMVYHHHQQQMPSQILHMAGYSMDNYYVQQQTYQQPQLSAPSDLATNGPALRYHQASPRQQYPHTQLPPPSNPTSSSGADQRQLSYQHQTHHQQPHSH